jgi:hypothetical protein
MPAKNQIAAQTSKRYFATANDDATGGSSQQQAQEKARTSASRRFAVIGAAVLFAAGIAGMFEQSAGDASTTVYRQVGTITNSLLQHSQVVLKSHRHQASVTRRQHLSLIRSARLSEPQTAKLTLLTRGSAHFGREERCASLRLLNQHKRVFEEKLFGEWG